MPATRARWPQFADFKMRKNQRQRFPPLLRTAVAAAPPAVRTAHPRSATTKAAEKPLKKAAAQSKASPIAKAPLSRHAAAPPPPAVAPPPRRAAAAPPPAVRELRPRSAVAKADAKPPTPRRTVAPPPAVASRRAVAAPPPAVRALRPRSATKPAAKPPKKQAAQTKAAPTAKAPAPRRAGAAVAPAAKAVTPRLSAAVPTPKRTPHAPTPASPTATGGCTDATRRRSTAAAPPPPSSPLARSPLAAAPSPVLPPNTDWFDAADPAKVAAVRVALQGDPPALRRGALPVGRAAEARALDTALARALASGRGGVAWVSGRSGSGKSLAVKALLDAPGAAWRAAPRAAPPRAPPVASVWLNCMLLQYPGDAASRLADALDAARGWSGGGGAAATLRPVVHAADRPRSAAAATASEPHDDALDRARRAAAALSTPRAGGGVVIVLDEADALATGCPACPLRALLALAAAPAANAVVVAVANAADAGLRLARAATADGGRDPVASIHFDPYGAAALAAVLTTRLAPLPGAAFHPRALRLLTTRVAARGGDARAAVKAAVKALELAGEDAAAVAAAPRRERDGAPLSPTSAALRRASASSAPAATASTNTLVGLHHADAAAGAASGDAWAERAVADAPPAAQFALVALLRASRRAAVKPAASATATGAAASAPPPAFGIKRALHVSCPPCAPPRKAAQALRRAPPPGAPFDAVFAAHSALCVRLGVRPASSADVTAALASLESSGLADINRGAERPRVGGRSMAEAGRRAVPRVGMDAVRGALAGTRLLAACLEE